MLSIHTYVLWFCADICPRLNDQPTKEHALLLHPAVGLRRRHLLDGCGQSEEDQRSTRLDTVKDVCLLINMQVMLGVAHM